MKHIEKDDLIAIQSIETGLIKFDSLVWGEVRQQLKKRYDSGFEICLDHPEYLKEILMEICGDSYPEAVKKITIWFDDKSTNERMKSLIKTLSE